MMKGKNTKHEQVLENLSYKYNVKIIKQKLLIGNKEIWFDGVSCDKEIVVKIITRKLKTSKSNDSNRLRQVFGDCFFLKATNINTKLLVCTDYEFYNAFKRYSQDLLGDIKLIHIA